MSLTVAVIGDNFMQASQFVAALQKLVSGEVEFLTMDLPFPDEPITQYGQSDEFAAVKEFQGDPEQVIEFCKDADALITHVAVLTESMLDRLPKLRFVGVSRGGPVNVDHQALKKRNIRLVNTPGRNASAVAEFTIGALIAETRNIVKGHDALRSGIWRGDLYRADVQRLELSSMTVGIVGYSHIGKRVGQLLKAFGSNILVSDPFIDLDDKDREYGIEQVPLDLLLAKSDAVTLHVPATPQTAGMINRQTLAQMKRGAVLINTSRGSLVDEDALVEALRSGQLSGAALDTYQQEPLGAECSLVALDNVVLTPHIAGASTTTVVTAATMLAEELNHFVRGLPPNNPV